MFPLTHPNALIRKLHPDEQETYRDFLVGLDPQTLRNRFCRGMSAAAIADHVNRVWASRAIVHGCFIDGLLRGAAELAPSELGGVAEAAFAVEPTFQNRGIGTALLDVTVLAARNRGCRSVRVICLRHNFPMRKLAQKAAAQLLLTLDEVEGEIHAPMATTASWLREAFVDACDLTLYLMRWEEQQPAR